MSVVRPHLLALVVLAAAAAYIIGRSPRRQKRRDPTSSLVKPIGLVIVTFAAVFAISAGANSLGLPSLTLGSVQNELDATTVSTQQGSSAFNNGGNSLSPLHLPQGMVTVLLAVPVGGPGIAADPGLARGGGARRDSSSFGASRSPSRCDI